MRAYPLIAYGDYAHRRRHNLQNALCQLLEPIHRQTLPELMRTPLCLLLRILLRRK